MDAMGIQLPRRLILQQSPATSDYSKYPVFNPFSSPASNNKYPVGPSKLLSLLVEAAELPWMSGGENRMVGANAMVLFL